MTFERFAQICKARIVNKGTTPCALIDVCAASDMMSDVLTFVKPGTTLLTCLTNPQVVRTAEMTDIPMICFVQDKPVPDETAALAREKGITILVSPLSLFEVCGVLYAEGARSGEAQI